jgi:hypothetical protein
MEPEGLLPCSQEPFTGPSPEPDQSSPYHPIQFFLRSIVNTRVYFIQGIISALYLWSVRT